MAQGERKKGRSDLTGGTLGTFGGVFTPSILTILGIILFLRLGYVVGSAGLGRALLIIGLANAISVLTTFSLSAISTNLRVKGGGDYYLISRTLGVEFGGAIGIVSMLIKKEILIFIIGGVFVAETMSVIIQVVSFKLFKKRVFLMSPLHHHFELKGWSESKIIVRFWIAGAMLALVALSTLKIQ